MIKLLTVQISSAILVVLFLTLTTVRAWDTSENTDSAAFQLANSSSGCPPWFKKNESNHCVCGDKLSGLVSCNATYKDHELDSWHLSLFLGQIMTSNGTRALVTSSPYDTYRKSLLEHVFVKINVTSISDLNNFTCDHLNRQSKVYCGECKDGYGPSVFTLDLNCYNCTGLYHGWALYLTFEILPLTAFFLIIIALQVRPASGILNSYVLFSQIVCAKFTFGTQLPFEYSLSEVSRVLVKILQTCYGFWNLDFFRHVIKPFCVSNNISNLHVLLLQYISVFYPMVLIFIAWICVLLHEYEFRPVVWIWKPFKRYLSHFSVTNNPKQAIMNVFTTFLILSYSKLIFISANLLNTNPVYDVNGNIVDTRLFFDPTLKFFQHKHLPFAFFSLIIFFTFIAIPPIILLLYQLRLFQKYVLKGLCPKWMTRAIQMFADAFQNCFKDGTNSTLDCRFFAGAYLVFRIGLFSADININNAIASTVVLTLIFSIATGLIIYFRPYKKLGYNCLDATMTALFAIGGIFQAILFTPVKLKTQIFLVAAIFMIASAPLIYVTSYILYKCAKTLRVLKPLVHWRRRGYQEISDYRYDSDYEWDSSSDQDRHYLEVGTTDSFQSE